MLINRIKFWKRIKSTLLILYFLIYLIHLSSLLNNEHIHKISARAFEARISIPYNVQSKKLYLGEVFKGMSYLIYTLFVGRSCFVLTKVILYLEINQWQNCNTMCRDSKIGFGYVLWKILFSCKLFDIG